MASADVQTIQSIYDAFDRGDIPGLLELLDPDIEWIERGAIAGTYHGTQSVVTNVFEVLATWDEVTILRERVYEGFDDEVVLVGQARIRPPGEDTATIPYTAIWQMRNGKPFQYHNHIAYYAYGQ